MVDLTTTYLGLSLKNPLVASASPFSEKLTSARRLEEAGVSAIVMHSLFEEQIIRESLELDHFLNAGSESFAEALHYLPDVGRYTIGPDTYVEKVKTFKQALRIPVIASLNGVSSGGWIDYAQKIEQSGADALELNLYYLPTDVHMTTAEIEENYVQLVHDVRTRVQLPLAIKLSPFFTALPNMAKRLVDAGANGLVLFNRFYQPDFDLDELEVVPNLVLSNAHELRLPLRWIAMLYGRIDVDFALTSGVHSGYDVLKAVMAGASIAMTASALLKHGVEKASAMLQEMQNWMTEHEYTSIRQMQGSMSQGVVADPAAFERANYIKVLSSYAFEG